MVTLKATGALDETAISCHVDTGRALVEAGLHPATGGTGLQACSGDLLLQALVACAGVTLRAVATALAIPVRGGEVRAEGDLDFGGRWVCPRTHRWASAPFACNSRWTPTPAPSSSPRWRS